MPSLAFCSSFVFPTEKFSTPSVLAVLVLCLWSLAFVTVVTTSGQPDLANLPQYMHV